MKVLNWIPKPKLPWHVPQHRSHLTTRQASQHEREHDRVIKGFFPDSNNERKKEELEYSFNNVIILFYHFLSFSSFRAAPHSLFSQKPSKDHISNAITQTKTHTHSASFTNVLSLKHRKKEKKKEEENFHIPFDLSWFHNHNWWVIYLKNFIFFSSYSFTLYL
jgi:hypothetical protein